MKKTILFILSFLLISHFAFGQWTEQNSGTTAFLTEVQFLNANVGYVIGWEGTMLKTIDGGANWNAIATGSTGNISAVFFFDELKGFIGYENGLVKKTTDGGQAWTTVDIALSNLYDVYFLDTNIGFISAQDSIFRTADGGDSWSKVNAPEFGKTYEFEFANSLVGYGVGQGIIKTTDGGLNWIQIKDDSDPDYNGANILTSCEIITEDFGFFASDYYQGLYTTTDGGASLTLQDGVIDGITFPTPLVGYLIIDFGERILKTSNAGVTWDTVYSNDDFDKSLNDIVFIDENFGWAVGWEGTIIHTSTGGVLPNATKDPILDDLITVFPNPTSNVLNIELPTALESFVAQFLLFDALGRKVLEGSFTSQLDLSGLVPGQYTLQVKLLDGKEIGKKVLVE